MLLRKRFLAGGITSRSGSARRKSAGPHSRRQAQPALAKARRRGRPPRRVGHNLLLRLSTRKHDVLRFLTDPSVPFTNNLAEQDLRMMKVKMKISGSFRTLDGAQIFARLRSVVSTARKQGCNILQTLAAAPSNIMLALTA